MINTLMIPLFTYQSGVGRTMIDGATVLPGVADATQDDLRLVHSGENGEAHSE